MLISSLLYTILNIKINIIFIVIKLVRYIFNLNNTYFTAVKRVYKYLKST